MVAGLLALVCGLLCTVMGKGADRAQFNGAGFQLADFFSFLFFIIAIISFIVGDATMAKIILPLAGAIFGF